MLIALYAILGIAVWTIIILFVLAYRQRRWAQSQPGTFRCALRISTEAGHTAWRHGYARWVGHVIVFEPLPALSHTAAYEVTIFRQAQLRKARAQEVKRLGQPLVVVPFILSDGQMIEIVARTEHRERAIGPFFAKLTPGKHAA